LRNSLPTALAVAPFYPDLDSVYWRRAERSSLTGYSMSQQKQATARPLCPSFGFITTTSRRAVSAIGPCTLIASKFQAGFVVPSDFIRMFHDKLILVINSFLNGNGNVIFVVCHATAKSQAMRFRLWIPSEWDSVNDYAKPIVVLLW
jgi:hypothetical protein